MAPPEELHAGGSVLGVSFGSGLVLKEAPLSRPRARRCASGGSGVVLESCSKGAPPSRPRARPSRISTARRFAAGILLHAPCEFFHKVSGATNRVRETIHPRFPRQFSSRAFLSPLRGRSAHGGRWTAGRRSSVRGAGDGPARPHRTPPGARPGHVHGRRRPAPGLGRLEDRAPGRLRVASLGTAAALLALDGFARTAIEISGPCRITAPGVRVHRVCPLPSAEVALIEAIPATAATRTLIDLAPRTDAGPLEAALDSALRRRLTSVAALEDGLRRRGGRGPHSRTALASCSRTARRASALPRAFSRSSYTAPASHGPAATGPAASRARPRAVRRAGRPLVPARASDPRGRRLPLALGARRVGARRGAAQHPHASRVEGPSRDVGRRDRAPSGDRRDQFGRLCSLERQSSLGKRG